MCPSRLSITAKHRRLILSIVYLLLLTFVQLYNGVSWVRYQYYWSDYPEQPVSRNDNPATLSAKEGSHYYHLYSLWYDPTVDQTRDLPHPGGRSTTTPRGGPASHTVYEFFNHVKRYSSRARPRTIPLLTSHLICAYRPR